MHGFGGHSARWEKLSRFFLKQKISSYAIDLRGFGQTSGLRGHVDSFKTYLDDLECLRNLAIEENPSKNIFLVAESVGGVISFLFAARRPWHLSGIILLSPAFKIKSDYTFIDYAKMLFPVIRNPEKQFDVPFDPKACTRDPRYQKQLLNDPMESRMASSKFIFELLRAQASAKQSRKKFRVPALFLLPVNDKLVESKATKSLFKRLRAEDKSIIEYKDMYHALSIDLEKEKVFKDMFEWIKRGFKSRGEA